jgi:hypothetical protein
MAAVCVLVASYTIVAAIPAAIALSILRHRLTYAVLAVLSAWWWPEDTFVGPVVLAVAVGVAFQPVRTRVQRAVDRLVSGRRREPYAVLTELGRKLETVVPPDEVLATLVREVCTALKVPFAPTLRCPASRAPVAQDLPGRAVAHRSEPARRWA